MDELFAKYEHELVILRSLCREYAQRYPKVAARLQLGGEACDDPHVERLIQAVALLGARVTKRLDDAYPQFTEALLNLLFPHYLRPFPSCAIARFEQTEGAPPSTRLIPRGTRLETRRLDGVSCSFQTAYDVRTGTAILAEARFDAALTAPPDTRLPADASSAITLVFASARPGAALEADGSESLRLYIDGDPSFCALLRDVLFMRSTCAFVEFEESGRWQRLPASPIHAVGFAEDEALIPFGARSHAAYRILAEYFAFPDKFNFFDVDLPALLARAPAGTQRLRLHLLLSDIRHDADQARMLSTLSPQHLRMGCTPVVNLFPQAGVPITDEQLSSSYTVLAHGSFPQAFEVYAIERAHMQEQVGSQSVLKEFHPFYSFHHGEQQGQSRARYFLTRRDDTLALCSPGHELSISLVDADCDAFAVDRKLLSIDLLCTNRERPCGLQLGAPEGDLFAPGMAKQGRIRLLRRPSHPVRLFNGPDAQWRLISHLALNHHSLVSDDGAALREMLVLYDLSQSAISRRQINGIVSIESAPTTAWIRHPRGSSLVHGMALRLCVDEDAFNGVGLHLFAQVMDQFFGMVVHINSFVEVVLISRQSGKELMRCKPRSGNLALL